MITARYARGCRGEWRYRHGEQIIPCYTCEGVRVHEADFILAVHEWLRTVRRFTINSDGTGVIIRCSDTTRWLADGDTLAEAILLAAVEVIKRDAP